MKLHKRNDARVQNLKVVDAVSAKEIEMRVRERNKNNTTILEPITVSRMDEETVMHEVDVIRAKFGMAGISGISCMRELIEKTTAIAS